MNEETCQLIQKACLYLLHNECLDVAHDILRNVIDKFNPFSRQLNKDDVQIVIEIMSPSGKSLIELISQLIKAPHFNQLVILSGILEEFHEFWIEKLSNISEQQAQVKLVDVLYLSQNKCEAFLEIHNAFIKTGGEIPKEIVTNVQNLFKKIGIDQTLNSYQNLKLQIKQQNKTIDVLQHKLQMTVHVEELLSEDLLQAKQSQICSNQKIVELQKEINENIQKYSAIIMEWESDNNMIVTLANSSSVVDVKIVKDQEINANNNIAVDDDDMKQMKIVSDSQPVERTTDLLLSQHLECNKLVRKQQKRLKALPLNMRHVFEQQRIIRNNVGKYKTLINEQQISEQQTLKKYAEIHGNRQEMKQCLNQMLSDYNTRVIGENTVNTEHLLVAKELQQSVIEMDGFSTLSDPCAKLVKSYMKYQTTAKINIRSLNEKLGKEWISLEQKWFEWSASDFIHWIRYKMNWFDHGSLPNDVNLMKIQQRMEDANVIGSELHSMKKLQILEFFGVVKAGNISEHKYEIVNDIFNYLQKICAKYPQKKIIHGNRNRNRNTNGEGFLMDTAGATAEVIDIPEKYKCKISNQLMSDPVLAFDGYTYDRHAIVSYLKQHCKSPVTGEAFEVNMDEGNEINVNEAFMLFDDEDTKHEIELFRMTHDL